MHSSRILLAIGLLLLIIGCGGILWIAASRSIDSGQFSQPKPQQPLRLLPTPTPTDVEVLVARRDLAAGLLIDDPADLFRVSIIPTDSYRADAHITPVDLEALNGMILRNALSRGQPVLRSDIAE